MRKPEWFLSNFSKNWPGPGIKNDQNTWWICVCTYIYNCIYCTYIYIYQIYTGKWNNRHKLQLRISGVQIYLYKCIDRYIYIIWKSKPMSWQRCVLYIIYIYIRKSKAMIQRFLAQLATQIPCDIWNSLRRNSSKFGMKKTHH